MDDSLAVIPREGEHACEESIKGDVEENEASPRNMRGKEASSPYGKLGKYDPSAYREREREREGERE